MGARVMIGTSGWSYQHWVGRFYPQGMPSSEWLAHYASQFPTVELNNTFYRLPGETMVFGWRDRTPERFGFAVKGSRLITHFRRLEGVETSLATFVERMRLLGEKLEVLLWQLPPDLERDIPRLAAFLQLLPVDVRHAIEFRHESWLAEETYDVLRAYGVASVAVSSDQMPADLTVPADFAYVRFHGLAGYHGAYVERALEPWAEFLGGQMARGRDAYAYFNNDFDAHAPADAMRLREMLGAMLDEVPR